MSVEYPNDRIANGNGQLTEVSATTDVDHVSYDISSRVGGSNNQQSIDISIEDHNESNAANGADPRTVLVALIDSYRKRYAASGDMSYLYVLIKLEEALGWDNSRMDKSMNP